MSISREAYQLAECLVFHYATFDSDGLSYSLNINDLPDFDVRKLSSVILSQDKYLTIEATGPDNKSWENKMLPALLKYLSNSIDKDKEIDFISSWRDGITSYLSNTIQEILDEVCLQKTTTAREDMDFYKRRRATDLHQGRGQ